MELAILSLPPTAAPAFVAGALVAAALTTRLLSLRRRGRLCPRCGSTTLPLQARFPVSLLRGRVIPRWCPGCGWEGLSFRPPHETRAIGGGIRLGGGFRWGSPPPPPSSLFLWSEKDAEKGRAPGAPKPLRPPRLGFRWKSLRE